MREVEKNRKEILKKIREQSQAISTNSSKLDDLKWKKLWKTEPRGRCKLKKTCFYGSSRGLHNIDKTKESEKITIWKAKQDLSL